MIDPRLKKLLEEYDEAEKDSIWLHKRGSTSVWIAKHAACERMATKAGITFEEPRLLFCNNEGTSIALLYTGRDRKGNEVMSFGEASPANNKNNFPWSIAEKRGKDRVILKLLGMHGMVHSEDEASGIDVGEPEKKMVVTRMPDQSGGLNTTLEMRKNLASTAENGPSQR